MLCDSCRFWLPIKGGVLADDAGRCRRYAPRPSFDELVMAAVVANMKEHGRSVDSYELTSPTFHYPVWPVTAADDGCGEWVGRTRGGAHG